MPIEFAPRAKDRPAVRTAGLLPSAIRFGLIILRDTAARKDGRSQNCQNIFLRAVRFLAGRTTHTIEAEDGLEILALSGWSPEDAARTL